MKLELADFKGEIPRLEPSVLPVGHAQMANDCLFDHGTLAKALGTSVIDDTAVNSSGGLAESIHKYNDQYFYDAAGQSPLVQNPVDEDSYRRSYYFTPEGELQMLWMPIADQDFEKDKVYAVGDIVSHQGTKYEMNRAVPAYASLPAPSTTHPFDIKTGAVGTRFGSFSKVSGVLRHQTGAYGYGTFYITMPKRYFVADDTIEFQTLFNSFAFTVHAGYLLDGNYRFNYNIGALKSLDVAENNVLVAGTDFPLWDPEVSLAENVTIVFYAHYYYHNSGNFFDIVNFKVKGADILAALIADINFTEWGDTHVTGSTYNTEGDYPTSYVIGEQIFYSGKLYTCIKDSTNELPTDTEFFLERVIITENHWDAISLNWDEKREYVSGEVTDFDDIRYVALQDNVNKEPASNGSDWMVVSYDNINEWDTTVSYNTGDYVKIGLKYYVAAEDNIAKHPALRTSNGHIWPYFYPKFIQNRSISVPAPVSAPTLVVSESSDPTTWDVTFQAMLQDTDGSLSIDLGTPYGFDLVVVDPDDYPLIADITNPIVGQIAREWRVAADHDKGSVYGEWNGASWLVRTNYLEVLAAGKRYRYVPPANIGAITGHTVGPPNLNVLAQAIFPTEVGMVAGAVPIIRAVVKRDGDIIGTIYPNNSFTEPRSDVYVEGDIVQMNADKDGVISMDLTLLYDFELGYYARETRDRAYVMTYYTALGEESAPGPVSDIIAVDPTQFVSLSALETNNLSHLVGRRLYRAITTASGSEYHLVADLDDISTTFVDAVEDQNLGIPIPTSGGGVPPVKIEKLARIGNFLAATSGRKIIFSEPYTLHSWSPANEKDLDFTPTAINVLADVLLIGGNDGCYIARGTHPANISQPMKAIDQACLSQNIHVMGSTAYFASPDGLVSVDGNGRAQIVSSTLFDRETWNEFDLKNSIISSHDQKLIFSPYDGGLRIFDFNTGAFIRYSEHSFRNFYHDSVNDRLECLRWRSDDQTKISHMHLFDSSNRLGFYWKSGVITLDRPIAWSVLRVHGFGKLNVLLNSLGEDGYLSQDITIGDDGVGTIKLPRLVTTRSYVITLKATGTPVLDDAHFKKIILATSFGDL